MILIAGAGATAEAARAIRKLQRNLNRRFARTRERIGSHAVRYGDLEPERTEFACHFLCGRCGYIVDDPHAEEGDEEDEPEAIACPACGDRDWIDLAVEPLADRIRDIEEDARMQIPGYVHVTVVAAALALFVVLAVGLIVAGYAATGAWFEQPYLFYLEATGYLALFVVPLAYFFLRRPAAVWMLRGRERVPHRWHVPVDLPDPEQTPERARRDLEVRASGEVLESPVSERECVAYQICVLFDVAGDARPPEWVLQEQRASDAALGDEIVVEADRLFLESPVEHVETPSLADSLDSPEDDDAEVAGERYETLKRFLRKRGLFVTEGEFHFYEACLQVGDAVDLADHGDTSVLRHTAAEASGRLPELPHPTESVGRARDLPDGADGDGSGAPEDAEASDAGRPRPTSGPENDLVHVIVALLSAGGLFWLFGSFLGGPNDGNWLFTLIVVWTLGPACLVGLGASLYWRYQRRQYSDYYESLDER